LDLSWDLAEGGFLGGPAGIGAVVFGVFATLLGAELFSFAGAEGFSALWTGWAWADPARGLGRRPGGEALLAGGDGPWGVGVSFDEG
jgi:hypothetical protein